MKYSKIWYDVKEIVVKSAVSNELHVDQWKQTQLTIFCQKVVHINYGCFPSVSNMFMYH